VVHCVRLFSFGTHYYHCHHAVLYFLSQSLYVRISATFDVELRFYNNTERRIASGWQFVPVFSQDIPSSFLAMRTLREHA